jgi:hypothetical protein
MGESAVYEMLQAETAKKSKINRIVIDRILRDRLSAVIGFVCKGLRRIMGAGLKVKNTNPCLGRARNQWPSFMMSDFITEVTLVII